MTETREFHLRFSMDDSGVISKLAAIENKGDQVSSKFERQHGAMGKVNMAYTEMSSKVNLLKDVWSTASSILDAPIKAAKEETARNVELIAALKARGEATKENIATLSNFANAQSMALAVDDEQIVKIQKIGLELGKISLDEVPAFVKATLGMAETTGKSFDASATAIAKWTSGAAPKIKGLAVDVGKLANIHEKLDALLPVTAGGYQAIIDKSNTFEGTQVKVNTAWGNTLSALGNMITTSPVVIDLLQKTAHWIQQGAEWLQKHPDAITKAGEKVQEWFATDGPVQTAFKDTLMIITAIAKMVNAVANIGTNWNILTDQMPAVDTTKNDPNSKFAQPFDFAKGGSFARGASSVMRTGSSAAPGGGLHIGSMAPGVIEQLARAINNGGALRSAEMAHG